MEIPKHGLTKEEVLQALASFKSRDMDWRSGKIFAYIYDPGKEAEEVVRKAYDLYLTENGLDPTTFPSLLKLETDVVRMIACLVRGNENVVGNMTTGGTESIMLAVKTARDHARAVHPEIKEPEIILCQTAHHAFHKAAQYFGLNVVLTPFDPLTFRADVDAMRAAITPNTILLVGSAPQYSQGVIDPIPEIAALALEKGLLCHVDACVGGVHLSFMRKLGFPVPPFDFTVPGVTSISVDMHKFGYAAKGASVVLYRDRNLRRFQIFTSTRTTCYTLINPTLLSTKSGGPMAASWAILNFLGEDGYAKIVSAVMDATQKMMAGVNRIPELRILGSPDMSLFCFTSDTLNLFQLADEMAARGWYVQPQFHAYTAPTNLHISVNYGNVRNADILLADLQESVQAVKNLPPVDMSELVAKIDHLIQLRPPDLFQQVAALAGISGGGLPTRMAPINMLLDSLPDDVENFFLIEYFNFLYA